MKWLKKLKYYLDLAYTLITSLIPAKITPIKDNNSLHNTLKFQQMVDTSAIEFVLIQGPKTSDKIINTFADGFQLGNDALIILGEAANIEQLVTAFPNAVKQFRTLTPEDSQRVADTVAAELDIPNDKVEEKFEESLQILAEGHALFVLNKNFIQKLGNFVNPAA